MVIRSDPLLTSGRPGLPVRPAGRIPLVLTPRKRPTGGEGEFTPATRDREARDDETSLGPREDAVQSANPVGAQRSAAHAAARPPGRELGRRCGLR